mmetsp:Transcript_6547/g.16119  ORF Transcript_6547/g.16119 Transcript_6547/m.16119 type:complete len:229 (+) Transcript_6547:267-953(+)
MDDFREMRLSSTESAKSVGASSFRSSEGDGSVTSGGGRGKAKSRGVADLFFYEELSNHLGVEASQAWLAETHKIARRLSRDSRNVARSGSVSPLNKRCRDSAPMPRMPSLDHHNLGNQSWPSKPAPRGRQLPSVVASDRFETYRTPDTVNRREPPVHPPSSPEESAGQKWTSALPEALLASSWHEHGLAPPSASSLLREVGNEDQSAKGGLRFTDAAHLIEMPEAQHV